MKLLFLPLTFLLVAQACAQTPTSNAPPALQVLSQQGPNLSSWVLAPIDRSIPDAIRQNITFLREDLVDEGKAKPQASLEAYRVAHQLCSNLIAVLDEREKMLLKAGYRAVQANVVTPATNQALEARRNYLMSWPQYEREVQQRNDLLRVGEAADRRKVELVLQDLKLEWAKRAEPLRTSLDALYIKLRAALRDSGVTTKTFDGAQGGSKGNVPAAPAPVMSVITDKDSHFAEHINNIFPPRSNVPVRLARNEQTGASGAFRPPQINGIVPSQGEYISTNKLFKPPVEIWVEAKTESTNLRLNYAADQIIFNWETRKHELRVDGGPAHRLHKAGAGSIPENQYVTIRWVVLPSRQEIYVDNQLRFMHEGDYSRVNNRVTVFCAEGSTVWVKSIKVRNLTLPQASQTSPQASVPAIPVSLPPVVTPPAPFPSQGMVTNSLGMKFVRVPGTRVLMCIHETRRQDYAAYAAEVPGVDGAWKNQSRNGIPVGEKDDHPVGDVSWVDAQKFCEWLSNKEGYMYRLPTDEEWSIAVGLGRKEKHDKDITPEMLSRKEQTDFPWEGDYPPKTEDKAGNYADSAWLEKFPTEQGLKDYTDGFATTAPVMSFKPNKLGLYDMGGNVWEWVEDWWNDSKIDRVLRGACWDNLNRDALLSSVRHRRAPDRRSFGFRCVMVVTGSGRVEISDANPEAPKADVPLNNVCPISGKSANPAITSTYTKAIAVCCKKCKSEFNAFPNAYLGNILKAASDQCPLSKKKSDPSITVTYTRHIAFADAASKATFEATPDKYIKEVRQ